VLDLDDVLRRLPTLFCSLANTTLNVY